MNITQFTNIKQVSYNNITMNYIISGGGDTFGQHYINFFENYYSKSIFDNEVSILEWCAGAGFIGFSLLAHALCKNITFIEQEITDVICSNLTIGMNNIQDNALSIHSNTVSAIDASTKFDIIVGNPPHFGDDISNAISSGSIPRITNDQNWTTHHNFFKEIQKNMHNNSRIILIENNKDVPTGFRELTHIANVNGLQVINVYDSASSLPILADKEHKLPLNVNYYFLELALT